MEKGKNGNTRENVIPEFRNFRIYKSDIKPLLYSRMTLIPSFNNLSDPTSMSLHYYLTDDHGGSGTPGRADDKNDGAAPVFNTTDILVGNTVYLTNTITDWSNIHYLVLTPMRDNEYPDNLGFSIRAYNNINQEIPLTPDQRMGAKPSPPAPPMNLKFNVEFSTHKSE